MYVLTDAERIALCNFWKEQYEYWFLRGFPKACLKDQATFYHHYLRDLRFLFDVTLKAGKIPPMGDVSRIPFLLVMPSRLLNFQRQYKLYEFKDFLLYVNLLNVYTSTPHDVPYFIVDVTSGRDRRGYSPHELALWSVTHWRHRMNLEEGFALASMVWRSKTWASWKDEVLLLGSSVAQDYVSYVDLGNSLGPVFHTIAFDDRKSMRRGPGSAAAALHL